MGKQVTKGGTAKGIYTRQFAAFEEFIGYVQSPACASDWIWRGQRHKDWKLLPSYDRHTVPTGSPAYKHGHSAHLRRFSTAAMGRRSGSREPVTFELGRHFGLATPLLDWSASPFVAAFFAYVDAEAATQQRAVWALHVGRVKAINIVRRGPKGPMGSQLCVYRPQSEENVRLVAQACWFSMREDGGAADDWVRAYHTDIEAKDPILQKLLLPDADRVTVLRLLNLMNINYATLFPDVYGAAMHANLQLQIQDYG
jgi:hypothetical protein